MYTGNHIYARDGERKQDYSLQFIVLTSKFTLFALIGKYVFTTMLY